MAKLIVLLSGSVSVGKSTLCVALEEKYGFKHVKTSKLLTELSPNVPRDREHMQREGEKLDRATGGAWVLDAFIKMESGFKKEESYVVDSVRIGNQIEKFRDAYGSRVVHIHLKAPEKILEKRYKGRKNPAITELKSYAQVQANKTEASVHKLEKIADVVIDTKRCTKEDVLVRASSHLGMYGQENVPLVDVMIGGEYGSEGKGHMASFLAKEYDFLIRVGGPNAGHKVVNPSYNFHLLPSGTKASTAKLIIAPGAVVNVDKILKEISDCQVDAERLCIDPQVMIISQSDIDNEEKLRRQIASTKQGVGAATARRIMRELDTKLAKDITALKPFVKPTLEVLEKAYRDGKKIFLEGTQGTGLSLYHGIYPYVTSRDSTISGCLSEAGIPPGRVRRKIMVVRTYPIRVQNPDEKGNTSGHMSNEITWREVSKRSGLPLKLLLDTERTSTTNRKRRVGEFDWELLRKASSLNGPTDIALSFSDYISKDNQKARRFEQLTEETIFFIEEIERVSGARVSLISTGFHRKSIIDRRHW